MAANEYLVPFGVDPRNFFAGLNSMEEGATKTVNNIKAANQDLQKAFDTSASAGDKLGKTLDLDTQKAIGLRDAAKGTGKEISTALDGKTIGTGLEDRINKIKKVLESAGGTKGVKLNLDFDEAKLAHLEEMIAGGASEFKVLAEAVDFAKAKLSTLDASGEEFAALSAQIETADGFLQSLGVSANELGGDMQGAAGNAKTLSDKIKEFSQQGQGGFEKLTALAGTLETKQTQLKQAIANTFDPKSLVLYEAGLKEIDVDLLEVYSALDQIQTVPPVDPVPNDEPEARTKSLRAQLREMKAELAALELSGQGNTAEFRAMSKAAGDLEDQIGDVSSRVRVLASDTKYVDAGIQAVTGLAGAFTAAQGAAAIFGNEDEQVGRIIQKVTGAMAILQGVQAVMNALNKDSALSVLLFSGAQTEAVVATEALAVAEGEEAVATVAATATTKLWNLALLDNPIFLVIAGVAALVTALIAFSSGTEDASKKEKALNDALKENNDILISLASAYSKTYTEGIKSAEQALSLAQAQGKSEGQLYSLRQKLNTAKRLEGFSILANLGFTEQDVKANEELLIIRQEQLQAIVSLTDANGKLSDDDRARADALKAQIDAISGITQKGRAALDQINQATSDAANDAAANNKRIADDSIKSAAAAAEARAIIAQKNTAEEFTARIAAVRANAAVELNNVNITAGERLKIQAQVNKDIENLNRQFQNLQIENEISLQKAVGLAAREGSKESFAARRQEIILASKEAENQEGVTAEKIKEIRAQLNNDLRQLDHEAAIKAAQDRINPEIDNLTAQLAGEQFVTEERLRIQRQLVTDQAELEKVSIRNSELSEEEKASKILAIDAKANADRKNLYADFIRASQAQSQAFYNSQQAITNEGLQAIAADEDKTQKERFAASQQLLLNDIESQKRAAADQKELYDQGIIDAETYRTNLNNIDAQIAGDRDKFIANAKAENRKPVTLFDLLGIGDQFTENQKQAIGAALSKDLESVTQITDFIVSQYQRQIDAKQKAIDQDNEDVSNLEDQLSQEKDLREQGLANNVDTIQAELDAKKAQREEDIKQQEELQKKQQAIQRVQLALDTATQASALITSAANIFKSLSSIPFIGVPLAIATIALMTGAFVTSKIKAFQAIGDQKSFGEGGWVAGKPHTQGGKKYRALDNSGDVVELEGDEFVTKKTQAEKYADLLEAINNDDLKGMNEGALRAMLGEMGIHLTPDNSDTVQTIRERDVLKTEFHFMPANDINPELKEINKNVSFLADAERFKPQRWNDDEYFYEKIGNKTKRKAKK